MITYTEFQKTNDTFSQVMLTELGFPGSSPTEFMISPDPVTADDDEYLEVYKAYDPEMSQTVIVYSNSAGVYGIDPYGCRDAELTLIGWGVQFLSKLHAKKILDEDVYHRLLRETEWEPNDYLTEKDYLLVCSSDDPNPLRIRERTK